ncbi:MAG: DUF4830 domain-containing protein [Clostridia bacterium]|nr:DUF4830 domain-containing protein [Clostridia bacterium]
MYITLTKKILFLLFCAVIAVFLIVTQFLSVKAERIELLTNAQRVEYIKSLKVMLLSDDYKMKTVTIPMEFGKVYENYNKLQLSGDFDLRDYKGKEVQVYTYNCDGDKVINLMIYKGRLIGGDISETRLNGNMKALVVDENGEGAA